MVQTEANSACPAWRQSDAATASNLLCTRLTSPYSSLCPPISGCPHCIGQKLRRNSNQVVMKFTKPAWVAHKGICLDRFTTFTTSDSNNSTDPSSKSDSAPKRLSIFSVHVHPDGSRIATGGLDAKVRIWSTKPILNATSEASNRPAKSLCTLTMHTGPVLCVRWANSGRWIASGSDDTIVMIWDLDP